MTNQIVIASWWQSHTLVNSEVVNTDSYTPIMNSDTLNLDSDEVREKSECVKEKYDTNV